MSEGEIGWALRHYGIHSRTLREVDLPTIVKWIDRGRPLIVGLNPDEDGDGDHWVVLYGYGLKPNRVFIANQPNPFKSRQCFTWGNFVGTNGCRPAGHFYVTGLNPRSLSSFRQRYRK